MVVDGEGGVVFSFFLLFFLSLLGRGEDALLIAHKGADIETIGGRLDVAWVADRFGKVYK